MRSVLLFCFLTLALFSLPVFPQTAKELNLETGHDIFQAACAGCHAPNGAGQPEAVLGFEPPATFPNFTDCSSSSREPNSHWSAMVHRGGLQRGFSPIMPAFEKALSDDEISKVIAYVRTLCPDPNWPSGDFNLPRPLFTEKAFPEDELVLTTAFNTSLAAGVDTRLVFEKRLGARINFEMIVPAALQKQSPNSSTWFGGVGDVSVELKRTLLANSRTGSILALAGELVLPTGDAKRGLGSGITQLESFLAYGQILPNKSFLQMQVGAEGPYRRHQNPAEVFWRTAVGRSFNQDGGFGRTWSPMLELVTARDLIPRARVEWDLVPQMQVTLNKRQHIRANVGFSIPTANTAGRAKQLVFYLLWDFFDGGLKDGWK